MSVRKRIAATILALGALAGGTAATVAVTAAPASASVHQAFYYYG